MTFEYYIQKDRKRLRCGYTTGSCAALAAKAAADMLLSGRLKEKESLLTPKGLLVKAELLEVKLEKEEASCAVAKDAGDDCDATDGILICARVRRASKPGLCIEGGRGVGRITRPGLDQPVGAAAINSAPRRMIAEAVEEVCRRFHYGGGLDVLIEVPQGEEIARRTFNPQLGIVGGISILGTSGIVEPQSLQALIDSIRLEMQVIAASGKRRLILTPGNYGEAFLRRCISKAEGTPDALEKEESRSLAETEKKETVSLTEAAGKIPAPAIPQPEAAFWPRVKCSNFIGEALDFAGELGFEELLLVGHIGKFCKLSAGIMNTHSRYADGRREVFTAQAAYAGGDQATARALMEAATADECLRILAEAGLREKVLEGILTGLLEHTRRRSGLPVEAAIFSNLYGPLIWTPRAGQLLGLEGFTTIREELA